MTPEEREIYARLERIHNNMLSDNEWRTTMENKYDNIWRPRSPYDETQWIWREQTNIPRQSLVEALQAEVARLQIELARLQAAQAPPKKKETPLEKQVVALLKILGLEAQEKSFIIALANAPEDKGTILVLADWLEEKHREAEAERLRKVGNKIGNKK